MRLLSMIDNSDNLGLVHDRSCKNAFIKSSPVANGARFGSKLTNSALRIPTAHPPDTNTNQIGHVGVSATCKNRHERPIDRDKHSASLSNLCIPLNVTWLVFFLAGLYQNKNIFYSKLNLFLNIQQFQNNLFVSRINKESVICKQKFVYIRIEHFIFDYIRIEHLFTFFIFCKQFRIQHDLKMFWK